LEHGVFDHATTLFNTILANHPHNKAALHHLNALHALQEKRKVSAKFAGFYEKLVSADDPGAGPVLQREKIPCLIEVNGDHFWMPGDLLRRYWPLVKKPLTSGVPSLRVETECYAWARDQLKPGDDALVIGPNQGLLAAMMGAKVGVGGRVFVLECNGPEASELPRILALNELKQVSVIEPADTAARTLRLDEFVTARQIRPTVIYLEGAGADIFQLAGWEQTLATYKPALVLKAPENSGRDFDLATLAAALTRFGYELKIDHDYYYCGTRPPMEHPRTFTTPSHSTAQHGYSHPPRSHQTLRLKPLT
jgi:hypothetical protein